jgi:hypothetical protein
MFVLFLKPQVYAKLPTMRFLSSLLLSWSFLILQISAAVLPQSFHNGLNSLVQRDGNGSWLLPVPTQDEWYNPPTDWEIQLPGIEEWKDI